MDDIDRTFSDDISRRPKVRVHVAGVPRSGSQRCIRCGLVLIEVVDKVSRWSAGSTVAKTNSGSWLTGKPLAKDEIPCDLFERN